MPYHSVKTIHTYQFTRMLSFTMSISSLFMVLSVGADDIFVGSSRRSIVRSRSRKAATRSVLLIGSHFGLGSELLSKVFGDLCQRARTQLLCETPLGGSIHDLKSLASIQRKRRTRLVWLEREAGALQRTFDSLREHAADVQLVHVLWDPMQACVAQWPMTSAHDGPNVTMATLCSRLRMDRLPGLYMHAKRQRTRSLQLRLEDLVGPQKQAWRQLSKFLDLPDKDVASVGARAVAGLRKRVLNLAAPAWVHAAIARDTSLMATLRKLRQDLEYEGEKEDGSSASSQSLSDED